MAKYAARLGQCFSSTRTAPGLKVSGETWTQIPDIKTKDLRYTFTDGAGIVTREFAEHIAREALDMEDFSRLPSAFQIRFGGFKGKLRRP